ncbi:TetR/AcrR family transcriptional regulator [Mycobacterium sp. NPDC050853]|uniref:TetR/AcrR family transcriptional regulator n=1 Tax=Mycobacterium sp. NPDC050853 TaxID=3155160 RepID=UPI0033D6D505
MTFSDVQLALIDAAEAIVAESGLSALSLRKAGLRAGQYNNSAVQYHFGSREGLVAAVLEARLGPIDEARCEMLAELDAAGDYSVRDLMRIVVLPFTRAVSGKPGSCYARFLAQSLLDPSLAKIVLSGLQSSSSVEVTNRLSGRTGLSRMLEGSRTLSAYALIIVAMATWEAFPDSGPEVSELEDDLVERATAVMLAPSKRSNIGP